MLWWKFAKFFMPFSKPQVSFSSYFASLYSVMKDTLYLCTFLSQTLHTLHKRNQSKWKFWEFPVLRSKFTKFLSFFKQQIRFSSNFVSLFSVMRRNFSIIFWLKFYILSPKGVYQSTNLVKFHVSRRKSEILLFYRFLFSKSYKVTLYDCIRLE